MTQRSHHHTIPWRRIIVVVAVMSLGFTLLWMVIQAFGETEYDPVVPTATAPSVPPTEGPPATPTQPPEQATPDAPTWPAGSLPDLLTLAPDRLSDSSLPLNDVAQYSNLLAWLRANGLTPATATDQDWQDALDTLAIPASLGEFGLDPIWTQVYGFDLRQVNQVLVLGQAPDYVIIMTGEFDPQALQSAWVSSGYQAVEARGTTVWTLFPGDQIDLSAPESRPAMGTMNNVVLLEDGTLIASARLSRLESVMDVLNGNAPSLADQEDVAALIDSDASIATLTSAVLSRGALLQGSAATMPELATPEMASPPALVDEPDPNTPPVSLLLSGLRLDDPALPRMGLWLVFDDADAAIEAAPLIGNRLASGISPVTDAPYTDRLGNAAVRRVGEVAMIDVVLRDGAADWQQILEARDLGFVFWLPDDGD